MKLILKKAYELIPFKVLVYSLIKKSVKLPKSLYQHLHFKDFFLVNLSSDVSFFYYHTGSAIDNELFWKGTEGAWEKYSVLLWAELSKNAEVVFDIGANTGFYSLTSQAANSKAQVFAFEPLTRIASVLSANIQKNNFSIRKLEYALSNKNGIAVFYDLPIENLRQATLNPALHEGKQQIPMEVNVRTVASVIEEFNIRKLDLVKIDVETYEPEVLEGFAKYLADFTPIILIEILDVSIGRRVELILRKAGYRYFYNVNEQQGAVQQEDLKPILGRNFFCSVTPIDVLQKNIFEVEKFLG